MSLFGYVHGYHTMPRAWVNRIESRRRATEGEIQLTFRHEVDLVGSGAASIDPTSTEPGIRFSLGYDPLSIRFLYGTCILVVLRRQADGEHLLLVAGWGRGEIAPTFRLIPEHEGGIPIFPNLNIHVIPESAFGDRIAIHTHDGRLIGDQRSATQLGSLADMEELARLLWSTRVGLLNRWERKAEAFVWGYEQWQRLRNLPRVSTATR
jgi:hypothetical protein